MVLEPDEIVATGVREIERERGSGGDIQRMTIRADYYVARIGDSLLVVRAEPGGINQPLVGAVVPVPADKLDAVRESIGQRRPDLQDNFLTIMIDATDFRMIGNVMLLCGIPILLIALWNIGKAVNRSLNIHRHPSAKALAKYGPLVELGREIEIDVAAGSDLVGRAIVTKTWIFAPDLYRFHAIPMRAVIWAYKQETRHVHFPVAVSGIIIVDRYGARIPLACRSGDADRLIGLIAARAPWAYFGFTDDLDQAAKRRLPELVAAVEQRRADMTRKS